jgi:hypothetical protein
MKLSAPSQRATSTSPSRGPSSDTRGHRGIPDERTVIQRGSRRSFVAGEIETQPSRDNLCLATPGTWCQSANVASMMRRRAEVRAVRDLVKSAILHPINRRARIHHDNRAGCPPGLPMRGTRDDREAGEGRGAPVTWPALGHHPLQLLPVRQQVAVVRADHDHHDVLLVIAGDDDGLIAGIDVLGDTASNAR